MRAATANGDQQGAMMRSSVVGVVSAGFVILAASMGARAGSLQVEPVLIDVTAPGAASTVTLRNEGTAPINAQIRIFRWSQVDGKETLEPTNDVVASPPAAKLAPQTNYVVRVVRVTKRPVSGEESYRVLVDQLPDAAQQKGNTVNLLVRYSIPVFFGAADRSNAKVKWSATVSGSKLKITAHNEGERRIRIASLTLRDSHGKTLSFGNGLAGYVLGKSAMTWTKPAGGFGGGGAITVTAQGDTGPINAVASAADAR
jgi:fimbrial chaperone protein